MAEINKLCFIFTDKEINVSQEGSITGWDLISLQTYIDKQVNKLQKRIIKKWQK